MNGEELQELLSRYVEDRKLLGYRQAYSGTLARFVKDIIHDRAGESIKTTDVIEWIMRVRRAPSSQSAILSALRGFLRFVKAVDPATSVPGKHLLATPRRNPPYVLSAAQLQSILNLATTARPRGGLRSAAYVAILGLLASSGLRIGEALHLKAIDVHLGEDLPHIVVRESKFKKAHIVPLHPTTAAHLRQYAGRRGHKCAYFGEVEHGFRLKSNGFGVFRNRCSALRNACSSSRNRCSARRNGCSLRRNACSVSRNERRGFGWRYCGWLNRPAVKVAPFGR
ncbi:site-specific integrase, partial [Paraburkholderia sp. CNPSo 3274]|uniref:tyrosine-type recombinase/integrase n=1 Tax=Paraburkholderia sp. CNPSo 3274 TaxID=2940932 RepID=UPI0020B6CAA2